jgi:8-oxo-dGTP pyrophosphatase MutT (NUDIX family)
MAAGKEELKESEETERNTRYQAAIIEDGHILLVRQYLSEGDYTWWNIPGGGREAGESEEQCVIREIGEETGLEIRVERLLIDGPSHPHSCYQRFKTYLCVPMGGKAQPGREPESQTSLIDVGWFDLSDESQITLEAVNNSITHAVLQRIRKALGYA